MMKARLVGLVLFMGVSMAAQAHHHTFALDNEGESIRSAIHLAANSYHGALATFDRESIIKVHHDGTDDPICGPIPEPGTYAMLLAGLGLMTTIARRKRMGR